MIKGAQFDSGMNATPMADSGRKRPLGSGGNEIAPDAISVMPRYYFDLTDSDGTAIDDEGLVLLDLEAAQVEAARALGDMTRDAARNHSGCDVQSMSIEVRADTGLVMQVRFSFQSIRKS